MIAGLIGRHAGLRRRVPLPRLIDTGDGCGPGRVLTSGLCGGRLLTILAWRAVAVATMPALVAAAARKLLEDAGKREAMREDLAAVVSSLGGPGASERAARLILATDLPAAGG